MPNWCENRAYIEASQKDIDAIIQAVQSADDSKLLSYLYPEPEYPEDVVGVMPSWYSWRVLHWGTKWEVDAEIVSTGDGWINLSFYSAWGPPIAAFKNWVLQSDDRSYNLRYIEWGMAFCGEDDSDGFSENYSIPLTEAEVAEQIPIELDEEFCITETVAQWEGEEA